MNNCPMKELKCTTHDLIIAAFFLKRDNDFASLKAIEYVNFNWIENFKIVISIAPAYPCNLYAEVQLLFNNKILDSPAISSLQLWFSF